MKQDQENADQAVACDQAKWATLINDTLVHAPQRGVRASVLKTQAGIADDMVLVRDHNSPHDTILRDEDEIDLANGNVFYSIRRCDAQDRPTCDSPAKLAFFVDDRGEITTNPRQTSESMRALFSIGMDRLLIRDFESPDDDRIEADEILKFDDGPVFVTRSSCLCDRRQWPAPRGA